MIKEFRVTSISLDQSTGIVTVTLVETSGTSPSSTHIVLAAGSPLISQLTIGRLVSATYGFV